MTTSVGRIVQISGPVVDVEFPGALPAISDALTVDFTVLDKRVTLTLEVRGVS